MSRPTTVHTFWDRLDRSGGPNACWPFQGARNGDGYGQVSYRGRLRQAHRVAFILWHGPTMEGIGRWDIVLHSCDNPPCCNPRHLTLGTTADNNDDMRAKGRAKEHTHGAQHGTYSGYIRHATRRAGWTMPACDECKAANTAYHRERRERPVRGLVRADALAPVTLTPIRSTETNPIGPEGTGS